MKRISLLLLLFAAVWMPSQAQFPDREAFKTIRYSVQKFAQDTPTPWMENYAWLQQQEMPWFARDTFTLTWAMSTNNTMVLPYDSQGIAWKVIFDPIWPNGSRAPVAERFEFRGNTCSRIAGEGRFLEDIGFIFDLDSSYRVLEVHPLVDTRKDGYLQRLDEEDLQDVDCRECIKVTYLGGEYDYRYLVGQHYRTVQKMQERISTNEEKLRRLLDRAVRETYAGFRILTIESCQSPKRVCWYHGDGISRTIRTWGKITAATGPKELEFEAIFRFPDGEEPTVDEVRIFK